MNRRMETCMSEDKKSAVPLNPKKKNPYVE